MNKTTVKTSPKDFFLHLLAMVALYASAISFTVILFQSVNNIIPDVLQADYYVQRRIYDLIRGGISFLMVAFPVYIWSTWYLRKMYANNPEKRKLWIRKWLVYFTLFVAALIIMVSLVVLVNTYLNGELRLRFILKFLTVLFVAGSIFGYHLWDEKNGEKKQSLKYFGIFIILVVLASFVVGFLTIGSPTKERLRRLDRVRINNLQTIERAIVSFWESNQALPNELNELNIIKESLTDPETKELFEYQISDEQSFSLCANFSTSETEAYLEYNWVDYGLVGPTEWRHESGKVCFERVIDVDVLNRNNIGQPIPPQKIFE